MSAEKPAETGSNIYADAALNDRELFVKAVWNALDHSQDNVPAAKSFREKLEKAFGKQNTPKEYIAAFDAKEGAADKKTKTAVTQGQEARMRGDAEHENSAAQAENLLRQSGDAWTNPERGLPAMMTPTMNSFPVLKQKYLQYIESLSDGRRKDFLKKAIMDLGNTGKQADYWNFLNKSGFVNGEKATPTCACAIAAWKNGEGKCSPSAKAYLSNGVISREEAQIGDFVVYDDTSRPGGGHIGIFMGTINGEPQILSENLSYLGKGYEGPIIHNLNDYSNLTHPRFVKFG